jgi:hypothetical protein
MSKSIIFDTEATGIKESVLIESAGAKLINGFPLHNPFHI